MGDDEPDESGVALRVLSDLTHALVADVDLIEFLSILVSRTATVLGAAETGIMLVDCHDELSRVASTSERMRILELFELEAAEGPCLECIGTGSPVVAADLSSTHQRWPRFTEAARASGFELAYAFPLQFRVRTIGAMNVFLDRDRPLSADELVATQGLANLAAIAVTRRQTTSIVSQLEQALESRVVIEQAKGIVAEHLRVDVDRAFELMRSHARSTNQRLTDIATDIRDGAIRPAELTCGDSGERVRSAGLEPFKP